MEDTRTTPLNQLIWTHRDWSTKDTAYMGLAQVLCMCIMAFSLVLSWDSWVCQQVGLSFTYLVLELFYFCWFAFPNFDVMFFFYLIMFYLVMFGSYLENNLKKKYSYKWQKIHILLKAFTEGLNSVINIPF